MTTITLIGLVALAAPVIWSATLYAWIMSTLDEPPPEVGNDDVRDFVIAVWISGFGGGLLVAEALRGLLE